MPHGWGSRRPVRVESETASEVETRVELSVEEMKLSVEETKARVEFHLKDPGYLRYKLEQLSEEQLGRRRFASEERRYRRYRRELAIAETKGLKR